MCLEQREVNMSTRNLYLHLFKNGFIKGINQPINDFTKPISRSEFEALNNRNKKNYNRFAAANNLQVYERAKSKNA